VIINLNLYENMAKLTEKLTKKKYSNLRDLFVFKLKSLLYIEEELVKALPEMAAAATDAELKRAFEEHLKETKEHVARIKKAFTLVDQEPETTTIKGLGGIANDAKWLMRHIPAATVRDASLVSSALEVENYEIGTYGTAVNWATLLGHSEIQTLLEANLKNEQKAADTLVKLGTGRLDQEAMGEEENTEEG
jgi:ferritin-like metal-binding protein YciE